MKGIVDRFEGDKVVLELDSEMKSYDRSIFPENLREGDLVDYVDGRFIIDEEKTKKRAKDIGDLFNSLKK